ncbi:MAG: alpha/beta fold hydrolase [Lachnospiraceae bacterium]|nr:alpha/beta fold hydrolase [Lachnospiraceae bacterium]
MHKYFDINEAGCSIRCGIYTNQPREARSAVIFGHGFGGHKDNRAAERFAGKLLSKHKDAAVITFDWPCHGEDGRKNLTLADCDTYLKEVIRYAKDSLHAEDLYGYATSFGGFLFLKYIAEHGMPFRKAVFRCPAVTMHESLCTRIMNNGDLEKLGKGKPALVGFDRKVRITASFLEELKEADIRKREYFDWADDLLIIHGTKDEIIPFEAVRDFAESNVIEFVPAENADHRFTDPKIMDLAIHTMITFMDL